MKYLNVAVIALVLLFAVGCSSMQDPISNTSNEVESGKNVRTIDARGPITYTIDLTSAEYDAENDLTVFTYNVISNPNDGPAISHWVIGFSEECGSSSILVDSNDPLVEWNESDPTTDVRGIKFDTGYDDQEEREVTLTLAGSWGVDEVLIAVKAGNGFVLGSVQGPICGGGNNGGGGNPEEEQTWNIDGVVFYDLNENGIQDAGEPGIAGVDVTLSNGSVLYTDENGAYLFADLEAGEYNVTVGEHNTRDHTTPASVDVTLVDADATVNFGFAGYEIDGTVFFDINGNGVQDSGEPGFEGVVVTLSNGSTVSTDANGGYLFDQLLPGDYNVSVDAIDGYNATTSTSVDVTISVTDVTVDFGFELDFSAINGGTANGFTIGFWKNNIQKAIQGKNKGIQVDAETLISYTSQLSGFALYPLNFGSLQDAYNVLSANGSDPILLLSKQLAGSEYNFANGAFINGNELLTWGFVYWGEYVIANASQFSASEILNAKDWFDAYNNSHGGVFYGPDGSY